MVGKRFELGHHPLHTLEHGKGLLVDLCDGQGSLAEVSETLSDVLDCFGDGVAVN